MTEPSKRDQAAQEAVRSGANRAIAAIEKAFIKHASGRYVTLKVERHDIRASLSPQPDLNKVKGED